MYRERGARGSSWGWRGREAAQSPVPVGAGQVTEGSDGRQVHTAEDVRVCSKWNRAEPVY